MPMVVSQFSRTSSSRLIDSTHNPVLLRRKNVRPFLSRRDQTRTQCRITTWRFSALVLGVQSISQRKQRFTYRCMKLGFFCFPTYTLTPAFCLFTFLCLIVARIASPFPSPFSTPFTLRGHSPLLHPWSNRQAVASFFCVACVLLFQKASLPCGFYFFGRPVCPSGLLSLSFDFLMPPCNQWRWVSTRRLRERDRERRRMQCGREGETGEKASEWERQEGEKKRERVRQRYPWVCWNFFPFSSFLLLPLALCSLSPLLNKEANKSNSRKVFFSYGVYCTCTWLDQPLIAYCPLTTCASRIAFTLSPSLLFIRCTFSF